MFIYKPFGLVQMAIFYPFWDEGCEKKVRTVEIKKVDDKPMVIHDLM